MPAQAPLADTFKLHSLPSASKRIYLDFDGYTTSDPIWNNGVSFTTPAYSLDDNPAFSSRELQTIQEVWARVTEDFAPFAVDVTTEEPSRQDLMNTGGSDSRWGIRVVIGENTGWYRPVGGVATLNSFSSSTDTPCFVFAEALGTAKNIAEASSHEVGHTLGLRHDGQPPDEYYYGQGIGTTSWAPIMGVGYSKQLTQWSRGEYKNANNTEDDLEIIVSDNGFGYRPDDYGNDPITAQPVVQSMLHGIVEQNTDVDVFSFSTTGAFRLAIKPILVGANLDVHADIVDSFGTVVAASNPKGALEASFNLTVLPGTYYLRVEGTGEGDPLVDGYSKYGSLGQYTVTFSGVEPPPDAVLVSIGGVLVEEGNAGETIATVTVNLSQASEQIVTVGYETQNGTATTGDSDYVAIPAGTLLTFAPGQTSKTIEIAIVGDQKYERNENFFVVLSNGIGGYVVGDGVGVCTIVNDDDPIALIEVLPAIVSEARVGMASIAEFTLKIGGDILAPFTISYATRDGSARAPGDYRRNAGMIQILPGQSEKRIAVSVAGDGRPERDETFSLVVAAINNFNPVTGVSKVLFTDPIAGTSARGEIVSQATIIDYDSRFFAVRTITPAVDAGAKVSVAIELARLPGYGSVLPSLAGVPRAYQAALTDKIQFATAFTVREGIRGPESAKSIFGRNRVAFGYVTDGDGGVIPKTAEVVEGNVPYANRRQTFTVRLSEPVNARLGSAATGFAVAPIRAAAFAAFSSANSAFAVLVPFFPWLKLPSEKR